MIVLDGKKIADAKQQTLIELVKNQAVIPHLTIVQIGSDPASTVYVDRKEAFGKAIGAQVTVVRFEENSVEADIVTKIHELNDDKTVHGIIVQLPIPQHLSRESIINAISPEKDVDGLTAINMWRLMDNKQGIVPATARAIETLLTENNIEIEGKHIVIVGDSLLVGKSSAVHFLNRDATVTVCHDKTKNLMEYTKMADILVVAVGKESLISSFHVREGQVIIDVGITRKTDGTVVGDVALDEIKGIVGAATPVPGGVGPVTVASLFENLLFVTTKKA